MAMMIVKYNVESNLYLLKCRVPVSIGPYAMAYSAFFLICPMQLKTAKWKFVGIEALQQLHQKTDFVKISYFSKNCTFFIYLLCKIP